MPYHNPDLKKLLDKIRIKANNFIIQATREPVNSHTIHKKNQLLTILTHIQTDATNNNIPSVIRKTESLQSMLNSINIRVRCPYRTAMEEIRKLLKQIHRKKE